MHESTAFWIEKLKEGDRDAAKELWDRYYRRLVSLARRRLGGSGKGTASDESDVAQSAFASFWRAAEQGRVPQLTGGADLWNLLITIAHRKIVRRVRYASAAKRRGAVESLESFGLDALSSNEPTPDLCAAAIESFQLLIRQLESPELKRVALMRMEGYSNEEIAAALECSKSTVERKLRLIRHVWEDVDRS